MNKTYIPKGACLESCDICAKREFCVKFKNDSMNKPKSKNVTMPRFVFEMYARDNELVRYLSQVKGHGWIKAVREEMELHKNYHHNKE